MENYHHDEYDSIAFVEHITPQSRRCLTALFLPNLPIVTVLKKRERTESLPEFDLCLPESLED